MAMQLGDGGGIKAEINVTPLVDVMLVLLIIMMIIAPLLQQGVSLRLPTAGNSGEKPETQDQTVLAIDASKRYYVNTREVQKSELTRRIQELLETKSQKIVIIKADDDVEYGAVMEAMDSLRAVGIEDLGLITDPKRGSAAAGGGQ
jgi:biopolymer transport protein TolR